MTLAAVCLLALVASAPAAFARPMAASAAGGATPAGSPLARPAAEKETNEVEVEARTESFSVIKRQRFAGTSTFTTEALTATTIPSTIEYEIVVHNTGETTLKPEKLSDTVCGPAAGPLHPELAPGEEQVEYTCSRELTAPGTYTNVAAVTANGKEQPSNKVEARLEKESFEIVKEQKLAGKGEYTTSLLKGAIGEVVDYRITATNTGEAPITFGNFVDSTCTAVSGGPSGPVTATRSTTWTCERTLSASGIYENVATVTGNATPRTSNKVVVEVPKQELKAVCALSEPSIVLHGATGSKRKAFTVRIPSLGIQQITFFLDGKKLKTLTASQAKHGQFEVRIDPAKLRFGPHKVSVQTVMADSACAKIARSGVFVHAKPAKVTPKFTG